MNDGPAGLRISRVRRTVMCAVAAMTLLSACDSVIYDYEGDCEARFQVRFRYDLNMKWADAFAHEVSHVTLYVVDEDGNVVWRKTEQGGELSDEGYRMDVDVPPGRYSLLAWCGTDDHGSFVVPGKGIWRGAGPGLTKTTTERIEDLACALDCSRDDAGAPYVDMEVDRLFHGYIGPVEFSSEPGTHTITLPLVKNTNSVNVVLQHLSGDSVDSDLFTFMITCDNGLMDWDNSLISDTQVTYYAWHTDHVEAGPGPRDTFRPSGPGPRNAVQSAGLGERSAPALSGAVARLTVGRMVKDHPMRLTVLKAATGETVLSVPLIDIALMVKDNYSRNMDDQEYLDRQDEYNLVFFLDESDRWISSSIYINSWHLVFQDIDI